MQAPGWKLFVYPKGLESQDIEVGGLTYYITFPDSNRTMMVSDFIPEMAADPQESSWRLKPLQLPSLIFDTYSYMHIAADPDENISLSPTGSGGYGWGTDFEFGFNKIEMSDTISLVGNFNRSDAVLIKVSQAEIDAAFDGRMADIIVATRNYSTANAFLYFNSSSSEKIGISFNLFLYKINFSYLVNGQIVTISAPFSHTIDGIHFKDTVNVGGYTFQDAYWDDAQQVYYINTGSGRVDIVNSDEPLFPFASVLGRSITTITVPTTPLPGQSAAFATVYSQIKTNLKNTLYDLDLDVMNYIFDDESKTMALQIVVLQDGVRFILRYVYSYTLSSSGIADFVLLGYNGNGQLVLDEMEPLLDYIADDTFQLDYFETGSTILGQFSSQQNADFFFTGTLQ
jgi:hypothetical protein